MKFKYLNSNEELVFYSIEKSVLNDIPVYTDTVPAGFPSPAEDHMDLDLNLHEYLVQHPSATFCVRVVGESMIDAGINDGDTVIIKKTSNADNGEIAVVLIDDQEATLKKIRKKGKTIALEAANKSYDTKIYAANRIKIQGKLVSLYRNFH